MTLSRNNLHGLLLGGAAIVSTLSATSAFAAMLNSAIYVTPTSAKSGDTVTMHSGVLSTTPASNIKVILAVHPVSANNVIAADAIHTQEITGLDFTANQNRRFQLIYKVPSSIASGKYAYVVTTLDSNNNVLLKSSGTSAPYVVQIEGSGATEPTPTPTATATVSPSPSPSPTATATSAPVGQVLIQNSGVYIPNKTVAAGQSIRIHNSIVSNTAVSNISLSFQIRAISSSGVVTSTPVAEKSFAGVNFAAKENKGYVLDYAIPATAASGNYIFAIFATNADKSVTYLSVNQLTNVNGLSITGGSTTAPTPTPTATATVSPSPSPSPSPTATATVTPAPVDASYLRGINIMDMGIAGHVVPGVYGRNYTRPTYEALRSLKSRGLQVVRLPFLWERVQNSLGGQLNSAYLTMILDVLKDCNSVGLKAILDMHNYGRYNINGTVYTFGQSGGPTQAHYADVWKKFVLAVKADTLAYNAVYAFDLMNEPYGLPTVNGLSPQKLWEAYAQTAVSAIRSVGETRLLHVEGYSWASASQWASLHPAPFINDPLNNVMYHAHSYMDNDTSGTYPRSHAEEDAYARSQGYASVAARGIARVKVFGDWCARHNQRCFLGEFGWPNAHVKGSADAAAWNATGDQLLSYLDSIKMGAAMWATGSWLSPTGNVLNAYVLPGNNGQSFTPLSQSVILEKHMGK